MDMHDLNLRECVNGWVFSNIVKLFFYFLEMFNGEQAHP